MTLVHPYRQLGLKCKVCSLGRKNYQFEDALWASMGNVGDLDLLSIIRDAFVCCSGFRAAAPLDVDEDYMAPVRGKDSSGARFSEYHFAIGVFISREPDILGLPEQKTGERFSVSGKRCFRGRSARTTTNPLPGRIVERKRAVRRESVGTRKRASSFNRKYGRPLFG